MSPDAAGKLRVQPRLPRSRHVDVNVGGLIRVGDKCVRVRATARLHRGDLARCVEVADVEYTHSAEALRLSSPRRLRTAVDTPPSLLDGHEQEVAVHGHVTLTAGADEAAPQARILRIGNIENLDSVVAPHEEEVASESHIRVGEIEVAGILWIEEAFRPWHMSYQLQVPGSLLGVLIAGRQARARV